MRKEQEFTLDNNRVKEGGKIPIGQEISGSRFDFFSSL